MSKFVQYADPQLGYGESYEQDLANLKQAVALINQEDIDFTFFCGDLVHDPRDERSWRDFKEAVAELDKPFYVIAGNHDITDLNEPAEDLRDLFEANFNALVGQFLHKGYQVIWFDTQAWLDERSEDQFGLVEQLLKNDLTSDLPKIVFGHHPLFLEDEQEETGYFNTPLEVRTKLLELFKASELKAYLCGHAHRNIIPATEGFVQVAAPSTCRNSDGHDFGFYLWTVDEAGLEKRFIRLGA